MVPFGDPPYLKTKTASPFLKFLENFLSQKFHERYLYFSSQIFKTHPLFKYFFIEGYRGHRGTRRLRAVKRLLMSM